MGGTDSPATSYKSLLNISMGNSENGFHAAFRQFVPEYHEILYAQMVRDYGTDGFNKRLVKSVIELTPDVIFMQLNDVGSVTLDSIKALSNLTDVFIMWTSEAAKNMPEWYPPLMPHAILCYANDDYVNETIKRGYNSYFFNIFDETKYTPLNYAKTRDIVFAGSKSDNFPMSGYRNRMVEFLHINYGNNFQVFGNGWNFGNYISRSGMNDIYNQAKIGIDCSQIELKRYVSDRPFHIMASGTFCLCKHYPDAEKDFIDGQHLRFFDTYEEMKTLIDYYLKHDAERNKIAAAGNLNVRDRFGFKNLERVINTIRTYPF